VAELAWDDEADASGNDGEDGHDGDAPGEREGASEAEACALPWTDAAEEAASRDEPSRGFVD